MSIFKDNVLIVIFLGIYLLGYMLGAVYDYGAAVGTTVFAFYLIIGAGIGLCLWIEK